VETETVTPNRCLPRTQGNRNAATTSSLHSLTSFRTPPIVTHLRAFGGPPGTGHFSARFLARSRILRADSASWVGGRWGSRLQAGRSLSLRHSHARRQNRRSNKDLRTERRVVFGTVKQQEALAHGLLSSCNAICLGAQTERRGVPSRRPSASGPWPVRSLLGITSSPAAILRSPFLLACSLPR
jgi:hypothetical protein